MSDNEESQSPKLEPEKLFEESTNKEFFGTYLFDTEESDYYRFSEDERGDSVWLVEINEPDVYYDILFVKDEDKYPLGKIVPRTIPIDHLEKIDESYFEAYNRSKIEQIIKKGGKSLGKRANKAFIDVLEKSVQDRPKVQTQGSGFESVMSMQYSILASKGFTPNVFVFPLHLNAILVQIGFIVPDQKFNNDHYVGQTTTGQDAFWSEDLPGNIGYLFSRSHGIMIYGKTRYWSGRAGPFTFGVKGTLKFNAILKNIDSVVSIEGLNKILTSESSPHSRMITSETDEVFVNLERLEELRNIESDEFDLSKLIRLCEELNINFKNQCYFAVAMLIRAIIDHVPPIFGFDTFNQVANNYGGRSQKSFKDSMKHLQDSLRNISDRYLHQTIRKKEGLPNRTQVNFSNDLDVLLEEIVGILK